MLVVLLVGIGLTLLAGLMLSTKIFHHHGVIENINYSTHALALFNAKTRQHTRYTWNDETKFIQNGKDVLPGSLLQGTKVVVIYNGALFEPYFAQAIKWKNEEHQKY